WLPEGSDWFASNTGTMLRGGQSVDRSFSMTEYPIYVKAGSIIPMYCEDVNNLETEPDKVRLSVFPGGAGKGSFYEDAGNDKDYATHFATTSFSTSFDDANTLKLTVSARKGSYDGMKESRNIEFRFYGYPQPSEVLVNGSPAEHGYVGE
ncbi:MAG: DUF5110 domain-containing protein, partial [Bacteroidales bacterium]